MGLMHISSSFFYFICKKDSPKVYYFNPYDYSVLNMEPLSVTNVKNAKTFKYTASKNGYYIAVFDKKMSVLVKGPVKYCAFLLNNKDNADSVSIKANFIDNSSKDIQFKKIVDNIYVADISSIENIGWFDLKGFPSINLIGFKVKTNGTITISNVNSNYVEQNNINSSKNNNTITSNISDQNIQNNINVSSIEYNVKEKSIQTDVKTVSFKTTEN